MYVHKDMSAQAWEKNYRLVVILSQEFSRSNSKGQALKASRKKDAGIKLLKHSA